ncbi:SPOR domain-containing protein [Vreelandella populi]|uniref:SPOR domain-containing protein n=1 Tax=Vreelandella populi TaxID=2498858 RepID=A0A433L8U0_9GAMM|nr:SPOR domain-containing protein [Halomonas populi]RUR36950.1 SPOR domain-containing protein [Halomonas populi]RUR44079.1 SPOR domain-containing protein [Halomonas populi]RUR53536.1 SPOR domain-containing protein [Halomonas populi]
MASPRKKPSRRGATSQRKAPRAAGGGFRLPGWLWGLAGMAAGFFLAQHQHGTAPWQDTSNDQPQATVLSKPESTERAAARDSESASQPSMPTFEFYTLLPETEVIAPGVRLPSNVTRPEVAEQPAADADDAQAPGDDPIAQVIAANTRPEEQASAVQPTAAASAEPKRYVLQAASFRELSDAEQLRGRLRNLSLLAQISEVQAGGDTWHRVQVGPYEDTRELNRAQDLMATQGIEPLLIQLQN